MIDIIYEDNHILLINKPINVPMVPDSSKDPSVYDLVKKDLIARYQKKGDAYVGIVQRLDRPVGGLCLIAKTSKAASRLSKEISANRLHKEYVAIITHPPFKKSGHLEDFLLKDPKTNTVKVDARGKKAILDYQILSQKGDLALAYIKLKTGRPHQIRVQFANSNHPLFGDQRYNKEAKKGMQLALFSTKITFLHPTLKKEMTFKLPLPLRYPFDQFKEVALWQEN